ncbi:hypothetical protein V495_02042 [Pseudogymnoascus sp. VKM F-4514 (FW-929)]|nr:hypothetical protein V495_02042 [Pseudogymnoascus sp. VKM F-4514 (FW-929)]KFY65644.1 hypothetical protein V497_01337 [Pseudogymnoascus sp. VKM F-4516 (FW-969)]
MIASQLSRSSRSLAAVPSVARAFTTTAIQHKTPSLADVTNNGVDSFNAKQKEFRTELAEKAKPKFEPSKLSIAAEPVGPEGDKPTGKLSSLIYGTKEGREMDQQIEQSFSQVLARGKYVHSIVFHEVKPDKVDEYVELVGNWYPKMASMPENKVHLVGSWRTEVGDSDTFGMFFNHLYLSFLTSSSPHLGVPEIRRLPLLPPLHRQPPRLPGLRQEAQDPHHLQARLPDAGIQLLAYIPPAPTGRPLRAALVHTTPRQPSGLGDALAQGPQGTPRGDGGRRRVVRADRRPEHGAPPLAVCGSGGAQAAPREELGRRGVGEHGA